MGQWTKRFIDGTKYVGTDQAIAQRKASWTKSRNDGIISVQLEHDNKTLRIFGIGEYWQADRFIYSFSQQSSQLTTRCIQLQPSMYTNFLVYQTPNILDVRKFEGYMQGSSYSQLISVNAGQWLTLEYDIINDQLKFCIKDSKI